MRFINGVVILFVLTISAWKCDQVNGTPGLWNSDMKELIFDTDKYFSNDKRNQLFPNNSIFTVDDVEFNDQKIAVGFNEAGHAGHSTTQQEEHGLKTTEYHVSDYNQQRKSSPYDQQSITSDSSSILQQVHNHKSVNQGGDDFVQNVDQLIVFNASKKLQQANKNDNTNRCEDSSVTPGEHPDNDRQRTDQPSRSYGQSANDGRNGQAVYNPYNRQQGSYASTGRQPVSDHQGVNKPSRPYGQSPYDGRNGDDLYPNHNRQQGSYPPTGKQPVDDRQRINQPSIPCGQSSYDGQNNQEVYNPYNRQQGSYPSTERQPVDDRQGVNQLSRPYGQFPHDRQNGEDAYSLYDRQQGSYPSTGRQPVDDRQRINQASGLYVQSSYDGRNGQGAYNPYNRQQGNYASTGRQPTNDQQEVNQASGPYGQSSYDEQTGKDVYSNHNRQQGSYGSTGRPFVNDSNTEQVNPNNDRSGNIGKNFIENWNIYSSVPLKEVDSRDGHKKLAGIVKIPGGVSSVAIERSPQSLDTSSVIKYGNIAPKGGVFITTNQEIGS